MKADEFFGNTYCVYQHVSLKDNKIFYIGLAKFKSRTYQIAGRNKYWHEIAKDGFTVEIIEYGLSKLEAYTMERKLIEKYGKIVDKTGILTNIK